MSVTYELIAPCFFGCESTASFELRRLGAEDLRVTDGRLTFRGGAEMIAAANLNLRTVERVLLLLASYRAETFDDLFDGVYAIPWEELLPADAAFPVKGSSLNSKLSSVPACQSIIKKAIVKRLMRGHRTSVLPETGSEYRVQFLLRKDLCEIMLDTSGEGLHKRGYRRNAMEAPLRETLAATIADLGRVRRDSVVEDPFCGSGTLVIEAAQKALNMAPGLQRRFAAERYSFVPPEVWAAQRQKALAEIRQDAAFEGFGYDIDPAAVELARANARLAGVDKRCHFEVADVKDFAPSSEAIVLTNPPLRRADEHHRRRRPAGPDLWPADGGPPLRRGLRHHGRYGVRGALWPPRRQAPQDVQRDDPLPGVYVLRCAVGRQGKAHAGPLPGRI